MFGCVVAGRLLQTDLQQVDETHALFELPNASSINHLCVFLLGTGAAKIRELLVTVYSSLTQLVPFPEGYGATVHFYWPGKGFQLLGMSVGLPIYNRQVRSWIMDLTHQALEPKAIRSLPLARLLHPILRLSRAHHVLLCTALGR